MDVANLLSTDEPKSSRSHQVVQPDTQDITPGHHYATRRSHHGYPNPQQADAPGRPAHGLQSHVVDSTNPLTQDSAPTFRPKDVAFELIIDSATSYKARLPMRVQIYPHDSTESIITTVKNFHGLYDPAIQGVNFEDAQGRVIIARYENFADNATVYVRVVYDQSPSCVHGNVPAYLSTSPRRLHALDNAPQLLPSLQPSQILQYGQGPSRPASRIASKRSTSPVADLGGKGFSSQQNRSRLRSRDASLLASFEEGHHDHHTHSDSDGGAGSVTSSRKADNTAARAEISTENIVEGGRRKRTKFESSELPLFVPPQVPASYSVSSISPQRRSTGLDNASPFAQPHQRNISYNQPYPSPQSHGPLDPAYPSISQAASPYSMPAPAQHQHRLRDRTSMQSATGQASTGSRGRGSGYGVLPTPDPTIASCISDEDVALQLMRLSEASNISYGRTSASTMDETMSGQADIASSATSDSEGESDTPDQRSLPPFESESGSRHGAASVQDHTKGPIPSSSSFEPDGEVDGDYLDGRLYNQHNGAIAKPKMTHKQLPKVRTDGIKRPPKLAKSKPTATKKPKTPMTSAPKASMSPTSMVSLSRKDSASTLNFQHHLGVDEEDLSTKPRCQRCRKSKKGCDRQRPCQRCKDAGIGIEGCVSEDEGNGRKGRFGRHMGVSVRREANSTEEAAVPQEREATDDLVDGATASPGERSKKRKRV